MKHLPWKLLAGALALGVLFDILFYKTASFGINVMLMQIAILSVSFGLSMHLKRPVSKGAGISAAFALLFAATFAVWTSDIGIALSALGLIASNIFFAVFLLGHHGKVHHPIHAVLDGVRYIAETYATRLSIFGNFEIPVFSLRSSSVVRGILIALPIIIIFAALFLGSDLILQQRADGFTTWLQHFLDSGDVIGHIALIIFFTFLFLVFFAGVFWKRLKFDELKELTVKHNIESAIILVSVNLLFLAFIIFQGVYLFAGQTAFEGIEDITYSEYAVHGFNELATIAVLVILLILTLRYFHTERTMRKIVHGAELVLIAETLLVVFSAWKRMALYVAQYDFTPARLFGFWFFIVCVIILLLLAYHIVKRIPQYKFMQQAPIVIAIAMLMFTASTPDALAVKLNVKRGDIDPFPLFNSLSAEAFDEMVAVLTDKNIDIGIMNPKDVCGSVYPTYNAADGSLSNILEIGTNDYPFYEINDVRGNLNRFQKHWDWAFFRDTSPREKGEPSIPLDNWRTWNLSRASVPRDADHKIPYDFTHETISHQDVADACGIPIHDPNFVPADPTDRRR